MAICSCSTGGVSLRFLRLREPRFFSVSAALPAFFLFLRRADFSECICCSMAEATAASLLP